MKGRIVALGVLAALLTSCISSMPGSGAYRVTDPVRQPVPFYGNMTKPIPIEASFYPLKEGAVPKDVYLAVPIVSVGQEELEKHGMEEKELIGLIRNSAVAALLSFDQIGAVERSPKPGCFHATFTLERFEFDNAEFKDQGTLSEYGKFMGQSEASAVNATLHLELSLDGRVVGSARSLGRVLLSQGWQAIENADGDSSGESGYKIEPANAQDIPQAIEHGVHGATALSIQQLKF